MIVLTGDTRSGDFVERLKTLGWGRMWVAMTPKPYEGEPWGFDNGAFSAWLHGRPFPHDEFMKRVDRAVAVGRPYLAVAPDIVGGGMQSLEFSLGWLDKLPEWPWYLAVQDGMDPDVVIPCLDRFAGIFLGGTTRFKSSAPIWKVAAHRHGLKFHYARAGTLSRIEAAVAVGADSLDSAFPLWTRERFAEFIGYLTGSGSKQRLIPQVEEWFKKMPPSPRDANGELTDDPLTGCST